MLSSLLLDDVRRRHGLTEKLLDLRFGFGASVEGPYRELFGRLGKTVLCVNFESRHGVMIT
jgi:hypothetical protein